MLFCYGNSPRLGPLVAVDYVDGVMYVLKKSNKLLQALLASTYPSPVVEQGLTLLTYDCPQQYMYKSPHVLM